MECSSRCSFFLYTHAHTFECVSRWFKATAAANVVFLQNKTCLICTTRTAQIYMDTYMYLYFSTLYNNMCLLWICRWINQRVSCLSKRPHSVFLVVYITNTHIFYDRGVFSNDKFCSSLSNTPSDAKSEKDYEPTMMR